MNNDHQLKIERLKFALQAARDKLVIYRATRANDYPGGVEYMALLRLIDDALA